MAKRNKKKEKRRDNSASVTESTNRSPAWQVFMAEVSKLARSAEEKR